MHFGDFFWSADQRGRLDWINIIAACPQIAQTLRDIHRARMLCTAPSSATASLVAASSTAQNAVSVDHKLLSTESLHNLPWGGEQDCFTSAAYQMEMNTDLEERRWSLSVFATACLFSPLCLCLLFLHLKSWTSLLFAECRIMQNLNIFQKLLQKKKSLLLRCCFFLHQILLVLYTCAFLWFPCFLWIPPNKCFLCSLCWVCSRSSLTSTG